MGTLSMFGKSHNVLGSTDADLILETKGNIKIRWHNRKFIDLLKNGKINTEGSLILHKVASLNDIKEDGIYLISDTGEVILSIDGQNINLSSDYISFLIPQELTSELKYQALTNIGFYYATLADATNIQSGLVYIVDEKKLYIAENGLLTEFFIASPPIPEGENVLTFDELWIGDLFHIYNDDDYNIIDANKLMLSVGGDKYLTLEDNLIKVFKNLVTNGVILSEGATSDKGFRLYYKNGKSVLEVDDIIWRNKPKDDNKCSRILDESITFSEHDNLILEATSAEYTDDEVSTGNKVICKLKYKHNYQKDLYIYVYTQNEGVVYTIECKYKQGFDDMYVSIDTPYPEDVEVEVTFEDDSTTTVIIPANETNVEVPNNKQIKEWKVIKGPETWSDGEIITAPALDKAKPKEYKITETTPDSITIELTDSKERDDFIKSAFNSIVNVSQKPYIRIKDNNLTVLDRSVIKDGKPDETVHSLVGVIKDIDFKFDFNFPELFELNDCPEGQIKWDPPQKKPDEIQVGIYSDNLKSIKAKLSECLILKGKILEGEIANSIAVNGKYYSPIVYSPEIYNAIFKEGCKYPSIEPTLKKDDKSHNIVYSEWVLAWVEELKQMIAALEAKVDKNKSDLDDKNNLLDLNNSALDDKITNILSDITDIEAAITNIELNYVKKSEFEELVKQYITPKYGDVNNPVALISGTIYRVSKDTITFLFKGSKKDKITSITPLTKEGLMTVTILNEGTLNITSISAILNNTELTKDISTTGIRDRGCGGHWFEAKADGNKIYIREIHLGDGNNDTWVTDTWTHDNAPLAINITVFGYITT